MWEKVVTIEGPYHFDHGLNRLALDPLNVISLAERKISLPIYLERKEVTTVIAIGSTEHPRFLVSGQFEETKDAVLHEIYRVFQWNKSLHPLHLHFAQTNLSELFKRHRGTPIVLDFAFHANLYKAIIHQQIQLSLAIAIKAEFVQKYGERIDGVLFYPDPEVIAKLAVEDLTKLRLTKRRAEYIIDLSKSLANKTIELRHLIDLTDQEVTKYLTQIRGIGPWTAQNYLLFALGRNNVFPISDVGIQRATKNLFKLDAKPSPEEMLDYCEAWQPYLSYAALYLWRSVEVLD